MDADPINANLPGGTSETSPPTARVNPRNRAPFDVLYPDPNRDDQSTEVDIVAVHGLGANVDRSWTWRDKARPSSPTVNWLKDPHMLPNVVPNSRIMVYNYDSSWHADAPRTRLQICGEELTRNLHAFREGQRDRPVVFIGHSLGGLVIQHALLFADREDEYRYLPRLTSGFIALGSPFRGTKMHGMAKFAARSMSLAGSDRGLLETLNYDNEILRDKLQEFCRLRDSASFLTCCFFEAYETDYAARFGLRGLMKRMVVPEESACIAGWERVQLQTDHVKLIKFSGPRDRSFLSVSAKVLTMCSAPKNVAEHQTKKAVQHQTKNVAEQQTEPSKGHWMVPFERNEDFVGREEVLRFLLDRIPPTANEDACQRTAIEGLGGVGKTQIALEAAFRLRHIHPSCSVFWVPAIDATTFEKAYHRIGRLLGVSGIDGSQADIKTLVKVALSQSDAGQWLLIIDNADDPRLMFGPTGLSTYFPSSMNGSILLTTRTREVAVRLDTPAAGILRTTKMSREEATDMIVARLTESQNQDTASITGLLDFLDDLPLAIRQASTFMHVTGMTTARYLEHCQSSDTASVNLLSQDFEDRGRYDTIKNPVATTWLISFEHVSRDCPQAGAYLRFMCFLAERDIPISLLPLADDEIEAEKAIGTLDAYGFITRRTDGLSIDLHRLVRLAMRNWLLKEGLVEQEYVGVIQRVEKLFPDARFENREVWMKYLAHAQSALETEMECGDDVATSRLLSQVGRGFLELGSYQRAAWLFQRSVQLSEKRFGRDDPLTLVRMGDLATALLNQGKYDEAAKINWSLLEFCEKVFGKEHPNTLMSMNNLALSLLRQGEYEEAVKVNWKVLELQEKVLGEEHPDTLISMSNLALNLSKQGEYGEAAKINWKVLELKEKVLGKEHPDTLISMNNLASSLFKQGELEEAAKINWRVLELRVMVLGEEHPDTLISMNNLALSLLKRGEYEGAAKINWRVLELREKVLGKEHPDTLLSMTSLAESLDLMGQSKEAANILFKTLGLAEKVLGKEHPNIINTMSTLAHALHSMGQSQEAANILVKALELAKKVLGKEHPETLRVLRVQADVLARTGQEAGGMEMRQ